MISPVTTPSMNLSRWTVDCGWWIQAHCPCIGCVVWDNTGSLLIRRGHKVCTGHILGRAAIRGRSHSALL